jgi:hypothetical protein
MRSMYWKLREIIRGSRIFQATVVKAVYVAQSVYYSHTGAFRAKVAAAAKACQPGKGVALCVRIRDEAPNLREFVEYYLAAGVSHFFFYEAKSEDDFHAVLDPFIQSGVVTLIEDWPYVPISPAAEHDCVMRCIGRYAWMGCIDADEFVVVNNNLKLDEYLDNYSMRYPAVALHWKQYGSDGHKTRPSGPVIAEYTRRATRANRHVKVFIRPERAARCRNPHSWYYSGLFSTAVNEKRQSISGSVSISPTAEEVWINHYHHKSDAEYIAKGKRQSIQDLVAIKFNSRTPDRGRDYELDANEVIDLSALTYHRALCKLPDCSICTAVAGALEAR